MEQNLLVFTVPQEQVQESAAGALGAGLGAAGAGEVGGVLFCCCPIANREFASMPPAIFAMFIPANAIIGPVEVLEAADFIASA